MRERNHNTHNTVNQLPFRSALHHWDITHKRVIIRADLNIESNNDFRLQALLPTLDFIRKKQGKIVLITHIGRPTHATPSLSTRRLIPFFQHYGYDVTYASTPAEARVTHAPILLLENIRFFPGEKTHDNAFTQSLAQLGQFYVNDGFGVLHRSDCSITQVPLLFAPEQRTFGLLVEKELNELTPLIKHPKKPFLLIIGGAKIKEKIPLIEHLLTVVNTIMLCPAIVFTFNKALNKSIGKSLIDRDSIDLCKRIVRHARSRQVTLLFPTDYQVALVLPDSNDTYTRFTYTHDDEITLNETGISIGPKTIHAWSPYIQEAETIFFNGCMGFVNIPETLTSANALFDILATAPGKTIIAGGDSVAAVYKHNAQNNIDYLSTGGGSALAYLSGQTLPGLAVLL